MDDLPKDTATDITGACLDGADLRGVDLSEVIGLTMDQVRNAIVDEHTRLPDYLNQPAS